MVDVNDKGCIIIKRYNQLVNIHVEYDGSILLTKFLKKLEENISSIGQLILDLVEYLIDEDWLESVKIIIPYPLWQKDLLKENYIVFDTDLEELVGTFPQNTEFSKIPYPCFPSEKLIQLGDDVFRDILLQKFENRLLFELKVEESPYDKEILKAFLKTFFMRSLLAEARNALGEIGTLKFAQETINIWEKKQIKEEDIQEIINILKGVPPKEFELDFVSSWINLNPKERPSIWKTVLQEENPDHPIIRFYLIRLALETLSLDEAEEHIKRYAHITKDSGGLTSSSMKKLELLRSDDPIQIVERYVEQVSKNPLKIQSWFELSQILSLVYSEDLSFRTMIYCYGLDQNFDFKNWYSLFSSTLSIKGSENAALYWALKYFKWDNTSVITYSQLATILASTKYFGKQAVEIVNLLYDKINYHPMVLTAAILINDAFGYYDKSDKIIAQFEKNIPIDPVKSLYNSLNLLIQMRRFQSKGTRPKEGTGVPPRIQVNWHKLIPLTDDIERETEGERSIEGLLESRRFNFIHSIELMYQINSSDPMLLLRQIYNTGGNYSIFAADFPEPNIALQTLGSLSFVQQTRMGFATPKNILIGLYLTDEGALAILGGILKSGQQKEVVKLFKDKADKIHNISYPSKSTNYW